MRLVTVSRIAMSAMAITVLSLGDSARAQDPIQRARDNLRREMVRVLESGLFSVTQKTTSITFAKRYALDGGGSLYCGEAFFGSSRRTFIIDPSTGVVTQAPSPAQWRAIGCDAAGAETFVDLR